MDADEPGTAAEIGAAGEIGAAEESTPLELRYRRWLHLLPRAYRTAREQEMVDTFLQRAFGDDPENADLTAKFGGVGAGEAASVLALALRLRWADPLGPQRYRVRSQALRTVVLGSLTVLAVVSAQGLLGQLWFAAHPPADAGVTSGVDLLFGHLRSPWAALQAWAFALWIPALVLATTRGRRAAAWAATLAAIPTAVTLVELLAWSGFPRIDTAGLPWAILHLAVVAGLAVLAAGEARSGEGRDRESRDREAHRPRGYLIAAGAAIALSAAITVALGVTATSAAPTTWIYPIAYAVVDTSGTWCLAAIAAAAVAVVRRRTLVTADLLALAAFALIAALLRAATMSPWLLLPSTESPGAQPILISVTAQLALAAGIAVTAGIAAGRRVRLLPPVTYAG